MTSVKTIAIHVQLVPHREGREPVFKEHAPSLIGRFPGLGLQIQTLPKELQLSMEIDPHHPAVKHFVRLSQASANNPLVTRSTEFALLCDSIQDTMLDIVLHIKAQLNPNIDGSDLASHSP